MLQTDNIAELRDRPARAEEVPELMRTVERGRIENNMRVTMLLVHMSADEKSVLALEKAHRELVADLIRFFRRNFSGLERLAYLISNDIVLAVATGDRLILPL